MSSEGVSLLPVARHVSKPSSLLISRLFVDSKAACLVFLWNFSIVLGYRVFFNFEAITQVVFDATIPLIMMILLCIVAMFSPMIGLLADIKISRHKAVLSGSYVIIIEIVLAAIGLVAVPIVMDQHHVEFDFSCKSCIAFSVILIMCLIVMAVSFMVCLINAFQFGLDQLQDSSTEDLLSYIQWYIWMYYCSSFVTELAGNLLFYDSLTPGYLGAIRIAGIAIAALVILAIISLLIVCLCVMRHRKVWFLLEPPVANPYKLVYKVIKFACQHKVPVQRSAFTYCEDELPSRLDLGKSKFGGPFTTKEVEDVKAFLGIVKVLFVLGPVFLLQTVVRSSLPAFSSHGNVFFTSIDNESVLHQVHNEGVLRHIAISNGLLSPLLVTISLPIYLWFIRPRVMYLVPGFFKRLGLSIVLLIVSLLCDLAMDVFVHQENTPDANCMFLSYTFKILGAKLHLIPDSYHSPPYLFQNVYFFTAQCVIISLLSPLLDSAVLEFICSQSPYSMKGLVLGLFFSLKNVFQAFAFFSMVPFGIHWKNDDRVLTCGSGYFLVYTIVAILTLALFVYVSRKYKYRIVNEPANEYRYAEDYYSKIQ